MELETFASPGDEVRFGLMECVESPEVEVSAIHDVIGTGYRKKVVQNIDVVHVSRGNEDKLGNMALQIHQRVEFDGPFGFAKLGPRKQRETQVDGGGVERVNRRVEVEPDVFVQIKLFGLLDEDLSEVGIDAPIALVVGMGEVAVRNRTVNLQ